MKKALYLLILMISLFVLSSCNGDEIPEITLPIETEPVDTIPQETVPTEPVETIPTEPLTIDAPSNVVLDQHILSWNAVSQASSYIVKVGETEISVNGLSYDLRTLSVLPGSYTLSVVAVNGDVRSLPSVAITYTLTAPVDPNDLASQLLYMMNTEYTMDLTQDDFDDAYAYNNYVTMVNLVTRYAETSSNMGMSEDDAIGFFEDTVEFGQSLPDMPSFSIMLAQMTMFDEYQMTDSMTAEMIYELALGALDAEISRLSLKIESYATMSFSEYSEMMDLPQYVQFYETLKAYASPAQYEALDYLFLKNEHDYDFVLVDLFLSASYDYIYFGSFNFDYFSYIEDEVLMSHLHNIEFVVYTMYSQNNEAFETFINTHTDLLFMLYDEYMHYLSSEYEVEWLQTDLDRYIDIKDVLVREHDVTVDALEVVITYVMTIKDSLSFDALYLIDDLIEDELLSFDEILLLKDEMVTLLQTNLPSSESFSLLFELMFYISDALSPTSISVFEPSISWAGETTHASIDLFLSLVGSIDIEFIEYLETFTSNLYQTAYDPMYDEEFIVGINIYAIIDLYYYLSDFVDEFTLEHESEIASLELLVSPVAIESLYVAFFDYAIETVQTLEYLGDVEKTFYTELLEFYQNEFDTIVAAVEVIDRIGMEAFNELEQNDFMMILNLYSLSYFMQGIPDNLIIDEFLPLLDEVISEASSLNQILVAEFDQQSILALLDLMRLPLYENLLYKGNIESFDLVYQSVRTDLANILINILSLENDFVQIFSSYSFSSLDIVAIDPLELLSQAFGMIGDFLSDENETLILDTWNAIFDDVLLVPAINDYLGLMPDDLIELQTQTSGALQTYINELQDIATWDLYNLTSEQQEQITLLITLIQGFFENEDSTFNQAIPLEINEEIRDFLPQNNQVFYKIYIDETDVYIIDSRILGEGMNAYAELLVFDDEFELIAQYEYNGNEKFLYVGYGQELIAGRTYYISIQAYDLYAPYYNLSIFQIDDRTLNFDDATPVYAEVINDVSIMVFEDVLFSFTAETSDYYYIYSIDSLGISDPFLVLFDSDLTLLDIYDDSENSFNFYTDALYIEAGETYYLLISNYSLYRDEISFVVSTELIEDPFSNATQIFAGDTLTSTGNINDINFYVFNPVISGYYDLYSLVNDDSIDTVAYIINKDYENVALDDNGGDFFNFFIEKVYLIEGQTYYFVIFSNSENPIPFDFHLSLPDTSFIPPYGTNTSFETSLPIVINQVVTLTANNELYFYYIFEPTVSGTYIIYSQIDDSSIDPYIYLYNGDLIMIDGSDDEGTYLNFDLEFDAVAGQTYYFEIGIFNDTLVTFDFRLLKVSS